MYLSRGGGGAIIENQFCICVWVGLMNAKKKGKYESGHRSKADICHAKPSKKTLMDIYPFCRYGVPLTRTLGHKFMLQKQTVFELGLRTLK